LALWIAWYFSKTLGAMFYFQNAPVGTAGIRPAGERQGGTAELVAIA
jgi:hypothetical protein